MVPLKILIVYLHELSHALATFLTGGEVVTLSVSPQQGGLVTSRGGSRFLILTAGYLGSLLIGVGLFIAAVRTKLDQFVLGGLGFAMILVSLLYSNDFFSLAFGIGAGVALLAMAWFLGHGPNDLALRVIGLASMIYVPYDIFSDSIARSYLRSDARMLAEEFGGTTVLWGGLWLVISLLVIWATLRHGLQRSSNIGWT